MSWHWTGSMKQGLRFRHRVSGASRTGKLLKLTSQSLFLNLWLGENGLGPFATSSGLCQNQFSKRIVVCRYERLRLAEPFYIGGGLWMRCSLV